QLGGAVLGELAARDGDEPLALEVPADRAAHPEVAAVLAEQVAHFAGGAVLVVGDRLDDHGDAGRTLALVGHLFVVDAVEGAGAAGDGAVHVVRGHAGAL